MLHKPAGYEVSQKPSAWPSVYTLLPPPLRQRNGGKLQAIGRLDQDTTGLLILSDDGSFIHRMTSPKKEVEKLYRVSCKHAIGSEEVKKLLAGVALHEEGRSYSVTVQASSCVQEDERTLLLGLTQGKYHQVKRMLAAVGNRVEQLKRIRIGALDLNDELAPGAWRFLSSAEVNKLSQSLNVGVSS
jgi:16S rRNA pseudouridine516 synthase